MSIDSYIASIKQTIMNHREMATVQLSSFCGLPFWYPLYPKKLEQQVLAISLKTLTEMPKESITCSSIYTQTS